jgi:hypothetical protein
MSRDGQGPVLADSERQGLERKNDASTRSQPRQATRRFNRRTAKVPLTADVLAHDAPSDALTPSWTGPPFRMGTQRTEMLEARWRASSSRSWTCARVGPAPLPCHQWPALA